jgi:hypothetical protein
LNRPVVEKRTHAVFTGFALFRKEIFDMVGGFNAHLKTGEDTEFGMRVVEKTRYQIRWAALPVLHLRDFGKKDGFGRSLVRLVSVNFHSRGKQYAETYSVLPLILKLRITYYALLLPVVVSSIFVAFYEGMLWMLLVPAVYLLVGLWWAVRVWNFRKGFLLFFTSNLPMGVALAYGTILSLIMKRLGRI